MIYSEILPAKNDQLIPCFTDGKPMHSKYNPDKEADNFVSTIEKSDFFVIAGIGGAYHIYKTALKFPESMILAIDNGQEEIDFLKDNITCTKETEKLTNVIYVSIKDFQQKLLETYLPAVRTSISLIEQKPWCNSNPELLKKISEIFHATLSKISADFSTQAYFGKLWTRNILNNLKHAVFSTEISLPTSKTALIVGAGPTLENHIDDIKKNFQNYYIISTDTAYKILTRNDIFPDAVFSVDGQLVSTNHFSYLKNSPLFIFELTANHSCVKKISASHKNIIFTVSFHPLENLAYKFSKKSFIRNDSSSGTVTIAAVDFAQKAGFTDIQILGADFAYINGKSYASGSYLDDLYSVEQNKIHTFENNFSKLMYRTPLIQTGERIFSTNTLLSYQQALENWLQKNNFVAKKENDIYYISGKKKENINHLQIKPFSYKDFLRNLKTIFSDEKLSLSDEATLSLLPLISYYKKKDLNSEGTVKNFNEYLKLARTYILRYT